MSYCDAICQKITENTIVSNSPTEKAQNRRESPGCKSAVVFERDFVKLLSGQVQLVKKKRVSPYAPSSNRKTHKAWLDLQWRFHTPRVFTIVCNLR